MPSTFDPALAAANRRTGTNNALRLGLLMFGLGAAGRGVQGLFNLGRRNITRPKAPQFGARTLDIPIEDEEKQLKLSHSKSSGAIADAFAGRTSNPGSWALSLPLAMTAGGAGLYGGYKLTDMLLDSRRKKELSEKLDIAKRNYEQALGSKTAFAKDLDALYDAYMEKDATAADTWGKVIGGGLAIGIPTALISGLLTYDMTKKRTPSAVLRKAKQKRQREQAQRQPPAVYARPLYQAGSTDVPDEDEMAGEPLDKLSQGHSPKLGFDAPGSARPAIPIKQPGTLPPYGPSGPALGGASEQAINPVGPGTASNHPMNTIPKTPGASV